MASLPITDPDLDQLLLQLIETARLQHQPLGLAYQLLYETGCRWNEITYLDEWDIVAGGAEVQFITKKTSALRTIDANQLSADSLFLIAEGGGVLNYQTYDRARLFMAHLLSARALQVGKKLLFLHAFRHNYARRHKATGLSPVQVQADMALKTVDVAMRYMYEPIIQHHP